MALLFQVLQVPSFAQNFEIETKLAKGVRKSFVGEIWLENQLMESLQPLVPENLNIREKFFERYSGDTGPIKRYPMSHSIWIEERICLESPLVRPPMKTQITSRFGHRIHPLNKRRHIHSGIDFRGQKGTPVMAASSGLVISKGSKGAYGQTLVIDHGYNFTTLYAHLSGYRVKPGQWVKSGQIIGFVGRTGRATGPHLHFEVRCHNVPLNPIKYLGKRGLMAQVKFTNRVRSVSSQSVLSKQDPNDYTRRMNLEKLEKVRRNL